MVEKKEIRKHKFFVDKLWGISKIGDQNLEAFFSRRHNYDSLL